MSFKIINVGADYYNSYLVLTDKKILIDTVPEAYADKLIENISKYIKITELDALIINHTEEDRSGAVKEIIEKNPGIEIAATLAGLNNLEQQLNAPFKQLLVKSNMIYKAADGISLKFLITHNINWPDSMMTYCIEEKNIVFLRRFFGRGSYKKRVFYEKS